MNPPKPLLLLHRRFWPRSFSEIGKPVLMRRLIANRFVTRVIGFGIWVGLWADPVSCLAQKAKPSPAPQATPQVKKESSDLVLSRAGERMADALAAFAEGFAAEEEGDIDRALEAYLRCLMLDASNYELAIKVAFELANRGDVPQGINVLKDAAKASPKEALIPLCLSQIYLKFLKKTDLAERYAQTAINLDPQSFPAYLALFEVYIHTGQQKKADAVLEKAAKQAKPDPLSWLQAAEILYRAFLKGNSQLNPGQLEKINQALQKATAAAENRSEEEGNTSKSEIFAKIANVYINTGQVKEAIPLFQKAIEVAEHATSPEVLAIRDKLARCYMAIGDASSAVTVLEALIKDFPKRYDIYEILGDLYSTQGQLDRALAAYQQALKIDGSQPQHFLRIADLQLRLGQAAGAVKLLTEAHQRFPRYPVITRALAVALTENKDYQKATELFAKTVEEARFSSDLVLDGLFYFQYGVAAERSGQYEKAAELLRKCIDLDPANAAVACNYLGYMWAEKGVHLDEAIDLIKRALAAEPENGAYLDSLGWCYFQKGEYADAIPLLERAAERLDPPDPVVFDHLGQAYEKVGRTDEAIAAFRKALALDANQAEVAARLKGQEQKTHLINTAAPAPAKE